MKIKISLAFVMVAIGISCSTPSRKESIKSFSFSASGALYSSVFAVYDSDTLYFMAIFDSKSSANIHNVITTNEIKYIEASMLLRDGGALEIKYYRPGEKVYVGKHKFRIKQGNILLINLHNGDIKVYQLPPDGTLFEAELDKARDRGLSIVDNNTIRDCAVKDQSTWKFIKDGIYNDNEYGGGK